MRSFQRKFRKAAANPWPRCSIQPDVFRGNNRKSLHSVSSNQPQYHFRRATKAMLRSVDRMIDRTTSIEGQLGVGRCPVAVVLA
jgi:hypothetical protein